MKVAIIVAAARNNVIGRENQLPWHLPGDLKYFKAMTLGKPLIMGRKTHESIGGALPGRLNVVVSHGSPKTEGPNIRWVHSVEEGLELARIEQPDADEIMIMGGAQIYQQALPFTDRIYLTRVHADLEGDAYFPDLASDQWRLESEQTGAPDAPIDHSFQQFERITKR